MAEYSFSASYISFFPTKKIRFRERFKHEVFPRLSRNELFIYSLFFLNVNISIIANTDAPIARIGMNRFVSSPVAGAESERGTLSSTIDVFFDALLFLAADADESGVLSSEMVVVPLCESVSLSLIPAVFVVGVGVVAGSIDSSGVTDGDAVTVSAVGVAVAASAVGVAVGASVTVAGVFVTVGVAVVFAVGVAGRSLRCSRCCYCWRRCDSTPHTGCCWCSSAWRWMQASPLHQHHSVWRSVCRQALQPVWQTVSR